MTALCRFLLVVFSVICLPGSAAFAQGLPESVAEPYVDYEEALAAGDFAAAQTAAEQAWRAGEAAGLDFDLQSALAANLAELAMARGEFATARDTWRWSAALAEAEGTPLQVAHRYKGAAAAGIALDDNESARDDISRAVEQLPAAVNDPAYLHVAPEAYLLAARIEYRRGRGLRDMGRYAQIALPLYEANNNESWGYAETAYYAAIDFFGNREMDDAAYYFLIAENGLEALRPDDEDTTLLENIANAWGDLSIYLMGESRADEFEARVAAADHPWAYQREWTIHEELPPGAIALQPRPIERTPPTYPTQAVERGMMGFAVVRFDVDPEGVPQNVEALFAAPDNVFADPSVRAIRRWRYSPRLNEDGEAEWRRGVRTTITYRMSH